MQAPRDIRGVGITFGQEIDSDSGKIRLFVSRIREGSTAEQVIGC
jgi:hypothetical protein